MLSRRLRAIAGAVVLAAVCGGLAGGTAAAQVDPSCRVSDKGTDLVTLRYAGANRYQTAVCVSLSTWADAATPDPKNPYVAKAVVLARGDAFPDALAGGPLASHLGAPLLLTSPTALLADVRDEIKRVLGDEGTVYLLGGTGSLSAGVESAVTSLGYTTKRLAGADRYQTAIKIAEALPVTSKFFVTTGTNFPDALAAGSAAAFLNRGGQTWALLFTNDTRMPVSTRDFATARKAQVGDWTLITAGGAADTAAKAAFGSVAESFVGRDRFATAVLIADRFYTSAGSLVGEGVGLANGTNFPDALAGTATLAVYGEPLLLTNTTTLPAATKGFLERTAGKVPGLDGNPATATLDVLGGTGVVSNAVENAAKDAFTP